MIGRLIVWSQGGNTFTISSAGTIDNNYQPYKLSDEPIMLAHPMEMSKTDVHAWQKYYVDNKLKQPFAQIWEPVVNGAGIKPNRYEGAQIPYYRFVGQEKHGITVEDIDFHNLIDISLAGCTADIKRINFRKHDVKIDEPFEIKNFHFSYYTRQVNHIVAYFDKVTIWDKIRLDDVSIMSAIHQFTAAQILEFIKVAQEANAMNVLPMIIEYRKENFSDFDPMEEFTLE